MLILQKSRRTWSFLIILAASCAGVSDPDPAVSDPRSTSLAAQPPNVRISELHYDNASTDVGEAIEISGPAGTDLTGWKVVLYNGNGGLVYNTQALSGAIPATCGSRGVVVVSYSANGIQNGGSSTTATTDADGVALVNAAGTVVELLSYEGAFAATNGPAAGMTSTDIGVRELGTEPAGKSLARTGDNTWSPPAPNSFGACNDAPAIATVAVAPTSANLTVGATQPLTATALDAWGQSIGGVAFNWTSSAPAIAMVSGAGVVTAVAAGDASVTATAPNGKTASAAVHVSTAQTTLPPTRFSEIHYDNVGTDVGEAIEVEGPVGTDLTGWTVVLYDGNGGKVYGTRTLSGSIPATCGTRGVVVLTYPQDGIQNGPDGMALVDASGTVVEFLSYEGTVTATGGSASGKTSTDIGVSESSAAIGQSLQRDSSNHWQLATATFGACNATGTAPPPVNTISFSGRAPSDVPLPVGFQAQIFATVRDPNNAVVTTTITWSSDSPSVMSVDQDGVITALAAGSMVLRATAADGVTTATYTLPSVVAVASTTAHYDGNTEFGEPTDADPSDDFIVRHPEYTSSYNVNRGTPNWVAYNLDASAFGSQDRCNCFTFDPDLPASFPRYTTADYTGAGAIAGFGIDRGHMTRSFDRTSASLDNAFTFYLSNVVPQASELNQGPWAILENDLGDMARNQNKEVYIIAGVAGNQGTLKNEGKIVIPESTWKVAVIMDRDHGLADIHDYRDLQVIAVNMPNHAGIRNVDWHTYVTTVDAIEALTGYDLLALLPDKVEDIVEAGIQPPIAALDGPYTGSLSSSIAMSGAASVDPNGSVVGYSWSFGDGTTGSGSAVSHVYRQAGVYNVVLTVADNDGLTDSIATTAQVQ